MGYLYIEPKKSETRRQRAEAQRRANVTEDEDNKNFFFSLLPLIRNFTAREKLEYRRKILELTTSFVQSEADNVIFMEYDMHSDA